MSKKGFTLVELIGVILVMGIIALIVIPIITPVIFESKQGAFKSTVQNLISSAENNCSVEKINGQPQTYIYKLTDQGIFPNTVSLKGKLPTSGYIYVDGECVATAINLSDGESYINGTNETIDMKTEVTNFSPFAEGTTKAYSLRTLAEGSTPGADAEYVAYPENFNGLLNSANIGATSPGTTYVVAVDDDNNVSDARSAFVSKELNKYAIEQAIEKLSEKIDILKTSATAEEQVQLELVRAVSYYIDYEHGISIIYGDTNFCEIVEGADCNESFFEHYEEIYSMTFENSLEWNFLVTTNFAG